MITVKKSIIKEKFSSHKKLSSFEVYFLFPNSFILSTFSTNYYNNNEIANTSIIFQQMSHLTYILIIFFFFLSKNTHVKFYFGRNKNAQILDNFQLNFLFVTLQVSFLIFFIHRVLYKNRSFLEINNLPWIFWKEM